MIEPFIIVVGFVHIQIGLKRKFGLLAIKNSSDYRCSNQTLVTIVGTIFRFEVRLSRER